jgi:hypothetical protein
VGRLRAGYALIAGGALLGIALVAALVWALGWQQAQQAGEDTKTGILYGTALVPRSPLNDPPPAE